MRVLGSRERVCWCWDGVDGVNGWCGLVRGVGEAMAGFDKVN